jgi:hypothetical protein
VAPAVWRSVSAGRGGHDLPRPPSLFPADNHKNGRASKQPTGSMPEIWAVTRRKDNFLHLYPLKTPHDGVTIHQHQSGNFGKFKDTISYPVFRPSFAAPQSHNPRRSPATPGANQEESQRVMFDI